MTVLADLGKTIWSRFPPLRRTNPQLAAAIGLVFGGIGLGIYFRSFLDFVAPIALAIIASAIAIGAGADAVLGWLPGAILASIYGFVRSDDANRRLELKDASTDVPTRDSSSTPQAIQRSSD